MKKKFILYLLLLTCLFVVGCGKDNSESSGSDGGNKKDSKKEMVLKCSNKDDTLNQEFYSELTLDKKTNQVKSGIVKFTLVYDSSISQEILNSNIPVIKDVYCSFDSKKGMFASTKCDVKLNGNIYNGEIELDTDKFVKASTGNSNDNLSEEDIEYIESYFKSAFGDGTTCETSK